MLTILIALGVLALCTAIRWYLDRPGRRDSEHLGGWLRLTSVWNRGASFGLPIPAGLVRLLSAGALAVLWTIRKSAPAGVGLLLGGGLSNLLERLRHGRVLDYLEFPRLPGKLRRYVYNAADLAVFLGGLLLILRGHRE